MKTEIKGIIVLVNQYANGGNAWNSWQKIKTEVLAQFPVKPVVVENHPDGFDWPHIIEIIKLNGINCIVSAGGDGTLNEILNKILLIPDFKGKELLLGAIALGSSNDFFKPVEKDLQCIPVRLNFNRIISNDLGEVTYLDEHGVSRQRFFLINASLGATAEANFFFNSGNWLVRLLKKTKKDLAILFAAIKTILTFKSYSVSIMVNDRVRRVKLTNLGIIKNPNISGSFKYDQEIGPGDGRLGFNLCHNMNKPELLKTLFDLAKGKFSGKRKRISEYTTSATIQTDWPVALETDGEVFQGQDFSFSIIPGAIQTLAA